MLVALKSFKFALNGIKDAFKSEPNLRIHFLASFFVIIFAIYLKFTILEFSLLILTIFSVIILELVNTIIEKIVDLHSLEISEEARIIKDMSAGTVLLGAIMSIIVGLCLFLPKLL